MLRDVDKSLNISFIRVKCQESVTELVMPTLARERLAEERVLQCVVTL